MLDKYTPMEPQKPGATILFVGPLPPPVGGFSAITLAMHQHFALNTKIKVFNRSPLHGTSPTILGRIGTAFRGLALLPSFVRQHARPTKNVTYIALSGGIGQLIDLAFIAISSYAGQKIIIHHHSFAYLNSHSIVFSLLTKIAPTAVHITLCACMKLKLAVSYEIPKNKIQVISNAAFLELQKNFPLSEASAPQAPFTIGFLANITREKGIFSFFVIFDELQKLDRTIRAEVAGPISTEIAHEFFRELKARPEIKYLGPVYGTDKYTFLRRIDALVFPTEYVNEAEPLTILEAHSVGTYTITTTRGCLDEMQLPVNSLKIGEQESPALIAHRIISERANFSSAKIIESFMHKRTSAILSLAALSDSIQQLN